MLTRTSSSACSSTRRAARTPRASSAARSVIRLSAGAVGRSRRAATIVRNGPWASSSASTIMGRSASRASVEWSRSATRSRSTDGGVAARTGTAEDGGGCGPRGQGRAAQPQPARGLDGAGAVDGPRHARARGFEQLLGALRRFAAGRVGVEEQYRLVAVALEEAELRRSEGRAQRGDRLGEAGLVGHEAIHVPFAQQRTVLCLDRGAREVGGVEQVAFDVERRLGRVEILGLLVAEGAAAEGDHAALEIADREEEAATESIVDARAA